MFKVGDVVKRNSAFLKRVRANPEYGRDYPDDVGVILNNDMHHSKLTIKWAIKGLQAFEKSRAEELLIRATPPKEADVL